MRNNLFLPVLAIAGALVVSACGGVADKVEGAANRSYTSYAKGKPYAQIAGMGQSALAQLAADPATFGPMIGATPLDNGMTVYRHMAPSSVTESSMDFGGIAGRSTERNNFRLSYFLVGPDGMVKDWAAGSVPGNATGCMSFIGGIIQRCEDTVQQQASLDYYDGQVLTSAKQPVSSWGKPASTVTG